MMEVTFHAVGVAGLQHKLCQYCHKDRSGFIINSSSAPLMTCTLPFPKFCSWNVEVTFG